MNKTKLEKIKKFHREGLTYREIAKKTKISIGTISNVLNGKTNLGYSRKNPETWGVGELKQKIAFSEAAIEAKGKSMEKVIECVSAGTKGKTFKPLSLKELSRTVNNMERAQVTFDKVDTAIKKCLSHLPPQNRSDVSVPMPIPVDSPSGVRVPLPGSHGSGYKTLKLMVGIGAVLGGIVVYKEIEKKAGTETALRLVQKVGAVLCGEKL